MLFYSIAEKIIFSYFLNNFNFSNTFYLYRIFFKWAMNPTLKTYFRGQSTTNRPVFFLYLVLGFMLMMTTITGSIILYDDSSSDDANTYGTCSIATLLPPCCRIFVQQSIRNIIRYPPNNLSPGYRYRLGNTADFDKIIYSRIWTRFPLY